MGKKKNDGTTGEVVSFEEEAKRLRENIEGNIQDVSAELSALNDPILEDMNLKHAFINSVGGKPMVMCKIFNVAFEREVIEFRSPDAITTQYSNQSVQEGKTSIELGKWWLKHSNRREYDTVIFDPDRPREFNNCFNLYEGLAVVPEPGSWKRTLFHIYNVLCNRERNKFVYTLKWFAWCLQNPGKRAEVVVIFKGKQGAGKGFIFVQFTKLFGFHGLHISNRKHLTGDFNGHMATCVFMFADEAYYPGDKEVEGALNQLITEEKIGIERKGRDLVIGKNCLHIGMATNAEWVIPAGTGDARRYYINEVNNMYAKNEASDKVRGIYFDNLWGEMNNGGREAMAYDLLKMDLKGWHPRFDVPHTEEFDRQVIRGLPREVRLMKRILEEGEIPGERFDDGAVRCSAKSIKDFIINMGKDFTRTDDMLLKRVFKQIGAKKHRKSNGVFWDLLSLHDTRTNFMIHYKAVTFDDMTEEWITTPSDY